MLTVKRAMRDLSSLAPSSWSPTSTYARIDAGAASTMSSPTLDSPTRPPTRSKTTPRVHAVVWVVVGAVLASVVSSGIIQHNVRRVRESSKVELARWIATRERLDAVSLGPRREPRLAALGRGGVPGPKVLLTKEAPSLSLYDALRRDVRYLTADSWSGEVGQLLSAMSLLYLAQETQRVAILPSVWRDREHYGTSTVRMGDLFDLETFRRQTGTLFVEWSDVKAYESIGAKRDEVGCIFSWNSFVEGASFGDYKITSSAWSIDRSESSSAFAPNSIESHVMSDYDVAHRRASVARAANETRRRLPPNLADPDDDDRLLCYTNLWGVSRAGTSGDWWNRDYKDFDGLQSTEGGMINLLHPAFRGVHPEWWQVGRHIDFSLPVWDIALLAIERTLDLEPEAEAPGEERPSRGLELPSDLITVHIRRGDFATWCASGSGCVAPIETYVRAVAELKQQLANDAATVLVTTDETSREFRKSVSDFGWYVVDHGAVGTQRMLESRYGVAHAWWDSAVDQAILSVGKAFVGTLDSQVSLVSALRVASWNDGPTRLVERPH